MKTRPTASTSYKTSPWPASGTNHSQNYEHWASWAFTITLGQTDQLLGQLDEAEEYLQQALVVSQDAGLPKGVWLALGTLAEPRLTQGRPNDGRDLLDEALQAAEAARREPRHEADLGSHLARRAEVEHLAGDPGAAQAALEVAPAIAATLHKFPASPLALQIAQVRALLDGYAN